MSSEQTDRQFRGAGAAIPWYDLGVVTRFWTVGTLRTVAILLAALGLLATTYSLIDGYGFGNTGDHGPGRHWQLALVYFFWFAAPAAVLAFTAGILASRRAR